MYDLALVSPQTESTWRILEFGLPSSEPSESHGFYTEAPVASEGRAWVRRHAEISLSWPVVAAKTAVVEMAPAAGLASQKARVLVNGTEVGSIDLLPGRRPYRVDVPVGLQRTPETVLRLEFERHAEITKEAAGRLAARIYRLIVVPDADPKLPDLLRVGSSLPVPGSPGPETRRILQVFPGRLLYSFRLPEGAELHATAGLLGGGAATTAEGTITLEGTAGPIREVWRGHLAAGERRLPVSVRLPGKAGEIVRLGFEVTGGPKDALAWVNWGDPQVVGRAKPDRTLEPASQQRLDALKRSLSHANVLLVVLDAASAKHFHCYGYPRATTPEIDRLAAESIVFEHTLTPAVFTLSAMSSLWTSQYPDENHRGVAYDARLPAAPLTLAELLSAQGIHTAGFVANAMAGPSFGLDRGFSEFHEVYRELGVRGEAFLRVVPPWLDERGSGRFFAYLHIREPHFPYDPEAPYDTLFGPDAPLTKEQRTTQAWYTAVNSHRRTPAPEEIEHLVRLYDGNLSFADHVVGGIRRALEDRGLLERTVVLVTADHGEALYEHGFISHGLQLFDESLRVPLLIRFPMEAGIPGARVSAPVDLLDVSPTIADVFGVLGKGGSDRAFHGHSLLPVVFGAAGKPAAVSRTTGFQALYGLRDDHVLFTYNTRYGQERLFDERADPGELEDRTAAEPVLAAYYRQILFEWLASVRAVPSAGVDTSQLPAAVQENLRALGYVQ